MQLITLHPPPTLDNGCEEGVFFVLDTGVLLYMYHIRAWYSSQGNDQATKAKVYMFTFYEQAATLNCKRL